MSGTQATCLVSFLSYETPVHQLLCRRSVFICSVVVVERFGIGDKDVGRQLGGVGHGCGLHGGSVGAGLRWSSLVGRDLRPVAGFSLGVQVPTLPKHPPVHSKEKGRSRSRAAALGDPLTQCMRLLQNILPLMALRSTRHSLAIIAEPVLSSKLVAPACVAATSSSRSASIVAAADTTSGGGARKRKRSSAKKTNAATEDVPSLGAPPPANWRATYDLITELRSDRTAVVDSMGCEAINQSADPETQAYQTLISLMLSSQTKDTVNFATMEKLRAHGLTVANILQTPDEARCTSGL